ncbi:MAG: DUF4837 family protein [bacterium]
MGKLREITVITNYWSEVSETVEEILCRPVRTPQPEPEFLLRVAGFDRFKELSRMRLVFLIGTVNDSIIRGILGSRLDSLPGDGFGLFRLPNAWVRDQWVLIFVARERPRLAQGLRLYSRRIQQTATELVLNQMTRATYLHPRNEELSEKLSERFGWTVDVPKRWQFEYKESTENFIYFFSHFPDRSIFVWWSDTVSSLNPDSVLDWRDRLTRRFYDGDSVDRNVVTAETLEFLGVPCLRLRGVWQNQNRVIGGPFVLYCFEYQGRFFILDGVVFNPGEKKLSSLFQVEAIIRTFVPR